ncbi:ribonuclease HII [Pseudactinotalea sp. HY160]|uniref:ribonuclease HII n=1 Tax=Pseudactinotalea sp. HY160 TaxID=2654490 RepID=UPI00128CD373|nr:ribonuclease HII [Pseudactinotalea sp. HY160]MPV49606.1 ribonuclease HII [Pseudactinotalea sp. HY160]
MPASAPTRTLEKELLASHARIAGMDEVGRGALAGPVSVGVVVVDGSTGRLPAGLRDSKLLTPEARMRLLDPIRRWCVAGAVGHASPAEIDAYGIIAALRLAGHRALAQVCGAGCVPDLVLLDGVHDWLTPVQPQVPVLPALPGPALPGAVLPGAVLPGAVQSEQIRLGQIRPGTVQSDGAGGQPARGGRESAPLGCPPVQTHVKGDLRISAIAAASVLAKTERDEMMVGHHEAYPGFGWDSNKGYAAAAHTDALRRLGPSPLHRRSWRLPGVEPTFVQAGLLD